MDNMGYSLCIVGRYNNWYFNVQKAINYINKIIPFYDKYIDWLKKIFNYE